MPAACFSTYGVLGLLVLPFLLYALYWRVKLGGTVIVQEDFTRLPNGDLSAGQAVFDAQTHILNWHTKTGIRPIPFDQIHQIVLEVRTSRKIHLWLGLQPADEWLHLGIVTNHDLKRAGVNGHLVAEVVAGQGEAFLVAFRQHRWQAELIGARFEYTIQK